MLHEILGGAPSLAVHHLYVIDSTGPPSGALIGSTTSRQPIAFQRLTVRPASPNSALNP